MANHIATRNNNNFFLLIYNFNFSNFLFHRPILSFRRLLLLSLSIYLSVSLCFRVFFLLDHHHHHHHLTNYPKTKHQSIIIFYPLWEFLCFFLFSFSSLLQSLELLVYCSNHLGYFLKFFCYLEWIFWCCFPRLGESFWSYDLGFFWKHKITATASSYY